jgi:Arc/MetJ-type ribon-helix-helix transcriptional regulator
LPDNVGNDLLHKRTLRYAEECNHLSKVAYVSMQLTPEQEERIRTVVSAGAYGSAEEALDAAVAAVEIAAAPEFEGTREELEEFLLDGLNSGEPVEADEAFWDRLRAETDKMGTAHRAPKPIREN